VTTRLIVCVLLLSALSAAPGRAATTTCFNDGGFGSSCDIAFGPDDNVGVYEFYAHGRLVVQFENVLTSFHLIVTVNSATNPLPLDSKEFPPGTLCVHYPSADTNTCNRYDFSGTAGGPNGVPIKNQDYKGLITLTLSYDTDLTVHRPAFGHAPGEITTFTEDILTSYSEQAVSDPTMGGKTPGLSSVVALDEQLTEIDTVCSLTVTPTHVANDPDQKPQVEVSFRLFSSSTCTGTPLRDKTAILSLSTFDSSGNLVFPPVKNVEGNKFHWDNKNGLNEYDISLEGLAPATSTLQQYAVTIFSSKFSPQIALFCVDSGSVVHQTEPGCH
jgi:hypothetical protein